VINLQKATLLKIFTDEDERGDGKPLFEDIVLKAQQMRLAGATVFRGPLGFGLSVELHTAKILRLSYKLPVVIEIIDADEKIHAFLSQLTSLQNCAITLAEVLVRRFDTHDDTGTDDGAGCRAFPTPRER
jgi:uncharacterized protein